MTRPNITAKGITEEGTYLMYVNNKLTCDYERYAKDLENYINYLLKYELLPRL